MIRGGTAPEQIALVAPSVEQWRAPLETVLGGLGVPYAIESRVRLGATPLGHALLQLLRYTWLDAGRRELFAFLRSPYSGLGRVVGRLRRGPVARAARSTLRRGSRRRRRSCARRRCPRSPSCAAPRRRSAGVRALIRSMLRSAYGTDAPPAGETSRLDLRAYDAALRAARRARRLRGARRGGAGGGRASPRSSGPRCGSRRRTRRAASP